MSRKAARETVMMLLYQSEIVSDSMQETLEMIREKTLLNEITGTKAHIDGEDLSYIHAVIESVKENREEIDKRIADSAIGWPLQRMSKVDLSILRLAICEMLYLENIPFQVAINEGVELSKKYGDQKTSSFVNGILGKIAREQTC